MTDHPPAEPRTVRNAAGRASVAAIVCCEPEALEHEGPNGHQHARGCTRTRRTR